MFKEENKSPEILKLNPEGKVPFVVINGEVYTESASVLRLIAQIMKPLASYYPNDPFIRQKIDSALDFNGFTLRPTLLIFMGTWVKAWMTGQQSLDEEGKKRIADATAKCQENFQKLEDMLKKNGSKFIATANPTIADHQLFCQMTDAVLFKIPYDNFPKIKQWMRACEKAPGIREVHQEWLDVTVPKMQAMMN